MILVDKHQALIIRLVFNFFTFYIHPEQFVCCFKEYVARNPDVIVIDPLESIMKLFDRHQQYILVKQCTAIDGNISLCV